jgi:hypothetical protein
MVRKYKRFLYIPKQLQNLVFDRAKATGLCDRKWVHIALILTHLRSRSRVSFRAGQKPNFEVVWVYIRAWDTSKPGFCHLFVIGFKYSQDQSTPLTPLLLFESDQLAGARVYALKCAKCIRNRNHDKRRSLIHF